MSAFIELFFIIVIIVIVFGASSVPALGESIGRLVHRRAKGAASPAADRPPRTERDESGDTAPPPET